MTKLGDVSTKTWDSRIWSLYALIMLNKLLCKAVSAYSLSSFTRLGKINSQFIERDVSWGRYRRGNVHVLLCWQSPKNWGRMIARASDVSSAEPKAQFIFSILYYYFILFIIIIIYFSSPFFTFPSGWLKSNDVPKESGTSFDVYMISPWAREIRILEDIYRIPHFSEKRHASCWRAPPSKYSNRQLSS